MKIQDIVQQLHELAEAVEFGGQLLKDLNWEFNKSINIDLYMKKVFNVNGMTGPSSFQKIQHNIRKINGVKLVQVSLNQNEVHVEFDSNKATEDVMNAIIHSGFRSDVK